MTSKHWIFVIAAAALVVPAGWLLWRPHKKATQRVLSGYANPKSCIRCHQDEAAGFNETGMAHSFSIPTAAATIGVPAKAQTFHHKGSNTWYSLTAHDGRFFERRWQKGFDGRDENVEELSIDYVMGSGNHARTYLHREPDGTLIELPMAWYAENGGEFAMNPGFDNAAPMTRRVIAYECMFCHNAYPRIPSTAHRDLSAMPVYDTLPMGIDCQRCHGPGAAHVQAAEGKASLETIRATILNPSHLSNERQMQVCEQCHLETTSTLLPDRIRRYDRQPFAYDPNHPLSEFNAYFTRDPAHGRSDNFEIDSSAFRLRQSQCYLQSKGALTCETCHDPHDLHKESASAQYYANICLDCHATAIRKMVAERKHTPSNQCVTCHMPQRRTEDVVHAVMTDHLIQRYAPTPEEALAVRSEATTRYEGPVQRYLLAGENRRSDDPLYDAVAQVIDKSNVAKGTPELAKILAERKPTASNFYIELGDAQHQQGDLAAAIESYRQALKRDPQSSRAARRLGVALGSAGQVEEALQVLGDAIAREPQNELLLYERAQIEGRNGNVPHAEADLRKALTLRPDYADALNNLGSMLAQSGDPAGAESSFRKALVVNPYDAGARANLGRLLTAKSSLAEANFQFQRSIELSPNDADVHLDYAIVLLQENHDADAQQQIRAALKINPTSPRGHDLMGQLAAMRGRRQLARAEFEAALKSDPDFGPAQLDLAEILIKSGDTNDAIPWLERASTSRSPGVAERARELAGEVRPIN